jgi:hypothetical protein
MNANKYLMNLDFTKFKKQNTAKKSTKFSEKKYKIKVKNFESFDVKNNLGRD